MRFLTFYFYFNQHHGTLRSLKYVIFSVRKNTLNRSNTLFLNNAPRHLQNWPKLTEIGQNELTYLPEKIRKKKNSTVTVFYLTFLLKEMWGSLTWKPSSKVDVK